MKKIAVCLSGCGFLDGAEIHESVLTLLAIDQAGAKAVCCAPDVAQAGVVNHVTHKAGEGMRNVLVESARIARGEIKNVRERKAGEVDALIFPGGVWGGEESVYVCERGGEVQREFGCGTVRGGDAQREEADWGDLHCTGAAGADCGKARSAS
jgi:enhancing lycopene biosynthesis protein 2